MLYLASISIVSLNVSNISKPISLTDSPLTVILSLQQPSGVFAGDSFGETDTRFSYCSVNALSLLGKISVLDELYPTTHISRKDLLTAHILRCNNFDGGFGSNEGAESHAAQGT